jgi:hypothetical protein
MNATMNAPPPPKLSKAKLTVSPAAYAADPSQANLLNGTAHGWTSGERSRARIVLLVDEPHHVRYVVVRNARTAFIRIRASFRGGTEHTLAPWRQLCSRAQVASTTSSRPSKRLMKPVTFRNFPPLLAGPTSRWDTIVLEVKSFDAAATSSPSPPPPAKRARIDTAAAAARGRPPFPKGCALTWVSVIGYPMDDAAHACAVERDQERRLATRADDTAVAHSSSHGMRLLSADEWCRRNAAAAAAATDSSVESGGERCKPGFDELVTRVRSVIAARRQTAADGAAAWL